MLRLLGQTVQRHELVLHAGRLYQRVLPCHHVEVQLRELRGVAQGGGLRLRAPCLASAVGPREPSDILLRANSSPRLRSCAARVRHTDSVRGEQDAELLI